MHTIRTEKFWLSLFFGICKVKLFCSHSFSRRESEIKMTWDRDQEVNFLQIFLRNLEKRDFGHVFFFQNQTQNMVERRVNLNFSPWPHIFMKNARRFYKGCFHSFFLRNGSKNTQLSTSVEVKRKWSEIGNKKWNLQEKFSKIHKKQDFRWGLLAWQQ